MSVVRVVDLFVDGRNSVRKFGESGFHLSYERERERWERIITYERWVIYIYIYMYMYM